MKRLGTILILVVLFMNNCLFTHAAHKHSETCYALQGAHSHNGNSAGGGECYKNAVYHKHSGSEKEGGACYKIPVYHSHTGDSIIGGECFQTPVFHTHKGDEQDGGECYQTPVYHIHQGTPSKIGGCYTILVYCDGNITSKKENISCNVTIGGVSKTTTWGCGCGGTVTQTTYWLNKNDECEADHGVYYEHACDKCGNFYVTGQIGQHTGFKYVFSCNLCGKIYNATGKCTTVKSYGLSCRKSDATVEKYELSCTKSTTDAEGYALSCTKQSDTIEGYKLSCSKNEKTVERYELSCTKPESKGEKVLICKEKETTDQSQAVKPTVPANPMSPANPSKVTEPVNSPKTEITKQPDVKEDALEKEAVKEDTAEKEKPLDFTLEFGLMADGVWSKLLTASKENLADEPYSWDTGESFSDSEKYIFDKDGIYVVAIKDNAGKIKAKKVKIDRDSSEFAIITDYDNYMTEKELRELTVEPLEETKEEETVSQIGFVQASPAQTQALPISPEKITWENKGEETTQNLLATTAKTVSLAALIISGALAATVFIIKRRK